VCQFRAPESMVVDGGAVDQKWTDILLRQYSIWMSTVSPYPAATNAVIKEEPRPIADALSKHITCSAHLKEKWIYYQPEVHWTNRITIRLKPRYSFFCNLFGQDVALQIESANLTWNTVCQTGRTYDTASLLVSRAWQLKSQREDIDSVFQNQMESRDANKC